MTTMHYRIRDDLTEDGLIVKAEKFRSIKETPCGYWVVGGYAPSWYSMAQLRKAKLVRWVSKTSDRRYCYPTIEEAMRSYTRRKERQVSRLQLQLEQAELALKKLPSVRLACLADLCSGLNVGVTPSFDLYRWDY